jgi:transcription elongation factor GreA
VWASSFCRSAFAAAPGGAVPQDAMRRGSKEIQSARRRQAKIPRKEPMTDLLIKVKKKLQDEIAALEHEMSVELPKELMKARAHGDLSENAEFKYAKERQGYVSARLGQLKKRLGDIGMLNLNNIPADRAGYGSRVWVLDLKKSVEVEYKLVSTEEADVTKGLISTTSPIGKALLGRNVGDEIKVQTPAGIKEFEIVRLKTIHEEE